MSYNVLIVDDDGEGAAILARALKTRLPSLSFHVATKVDQALQLLEKLSPPVVIQDLCIDERIGPKSGFGLLSEILSKDPTIRVILLTGFGSAEHGVKALEMGAASFLEKPAEIQHLSVLIQDGLNQSNLKREVAALRAGAGASSCEILGESDQIKRVRELVSQASRNSQSVLITGETGTGKGLVARTIHRQSLRSSKNFVRFQPNYGNADLVASELFGHVVGAFTGADRARLGLIAHAKDGTLFLDEIDELPIPTQVALLETLQERVYRVVGSNQEESAEFRLIAATNRNLTEAINLGKLRQDFFHRIAHFKIHIPALRERPEDIKILADAKLNSLREKEGINIYEIESEAQQILKSYEWPGNVRELEAVIEGAAFRANFAGRTTITALELSLGNQERAALSTGFEALVNKYKLDLINSALAKHSGNQVKAAEELKMDRSTLRRILDRGLN